MAQTIHWNECADAHSPARRRKSALKAMPNQHHSKLPQLLQSVEAESGAVALGIVLASHGRSCTLRELSEACGVTRDGTTPEKLLQAAEAF